MINGKMTEKIDSGEGMEFNSYHYEILALESLTAAQNLDLVNEVDDPDPWNVTMYLAQAQVYAALALAAATDEVAAKLEKRGR